MSKKKKPLPFLVLFLLLLCQLALGSVIPSLPRRTLLYSDDVPQSAGLGSRESTSFYCKLQDYFVQLNCSNAVALIVYNGSTYFDFPTQFGLNASQFVSTPNDIMVALNWTRFIDGTPWLVPDLKVAGVTNYKFWSGSRARCREWTDPTLCAGNANYGDNNIYQTNLEGCDTFKSVVCVCINGLPLGTPAPTTQQPSTGPTTSQPTRTPTNYPSVSPSTSPTTSYPTHVPTYSPQTSKPTTSPTHKPTKPPTTLQPTQLPTKSPTNTPTVSPTFAPTLLWSYSAFTCRVSQSRMSVALSQTTVAIGDWAGSDYSNGMFEYGNADLSTISGAIVPSDTTGLSPRIGFSVSVSDGDYHYIAVGVQQNNNGWGGIWVYRSATEYQVLNPPYAGWCGTSVAVQYRSDGSMKVVAGCPGYSSNQGALTTWDRDNTGHWYTPSFYTVTGAGGDMFGNSVALSNDLNSFAGGSPYNNANMGAIWIYNYFVGWGSPVKYTSGVANSYFGYSMAMAINNPAILVVGAPNENSAVGAAYVLTVSGATVINSFKLVPKDEVGAGQFGYGVAVDSTGTYIAVTAYYDNTNVGALFMFARTGTYSFSQQGAKLLSPAALVNNGQLGYSVALRPDGKEVVVCTYSSSPSYDSCCASYTNSDTFRPTKSPTTTKPTTSPTTTKPTRNPTHSPSASPSAAPTTYVEWIQQGGGINQGSGGGSGRRRLSTSTQHQGFSSAMSKDGLVSVIGAPGYSSSAGAAFIFLRFDQEFGENDNAPLSCNGVTAASEQGYAVAVSEFGLTIAVSAPYDNATNGAVCVFEYNATLDDWIQQGTKLVSSSVSTGSLQGSSVSISGDGNTLVVGAPFDRSLNGSVVVWTRSNSKWTQQSVLVGSGGSGIVMEQGTAVAVSLIDGNTLAFSSTNDGNSNFATWMFTRSNGVWTQQGSKITVATTTTAFVPGLALSSDGNLLAIGSPKDSSGIGSVTIYQRTAGVWTQRGNKLVGRDYSGSANFGSSVSFGDNGKILAVGSPGDSSSKGATTTFTQTPNGDWSQSMSKLVASGADNSSQQGASLALAPSGNYMLVGAPGYQNQTGGFAFFMNTKYSFAPTYSPSTAPSRSPSKTPTTSKPTASPSHAPTEFVLMTQQGSKLVATGTNAGPYLGYNVALSKDGNTLAAGAIADGSSGSIIIYNRTGTTWTQVARLIPSDTSGSQLSPCDLSADGNTLVIGGSRDNGGAGATWVFTRSLGIWTQVGSKLIGSGVIGSGANQGGSVAVSGDGKTLVTGAIADNGFTGAAWVFYWNGASWGTGSKLTAASGSGGRFGYAVDISRDGKTIAIGAPYSGNNGTVWIFTGSAGSYTQSGSAIVPTDFSGSQSAVFGHSLSLNSDGSVLAVGLGNQAQFETPVWVYKYTTGTGWSEQAKINVPTDVIQLNPTDPVLFGFALDLNDDGDFLAIGGYGDNDVAYGVYNSIGATWIYAYRGTTWMEEAKLIGTGYVDGSYQGWSVAVDGTGNTVATGGYQDNGYNGAVWIFVDTEMTWTPSRTPTFSPSTSPTTSKPTTSPTTSTPSKGPTTSTPTKNPTTSKPTVSPSKNPTTSVPSKGPTTSKPTTSPSKNPTTSRPTTSPTTSKPTKNPTTSKPTVSPSKNPTTSVPSKGPTTSVPSKGPTTSTPTKSPTTSKPSTTPTKNPTTSNPTKNPTTSIPTRSPSKTPTTSKPTTSPSKAPTEFVQWTQQGGKLVGSGYSAVQPEQGWAVTLSKDGNTLAFVGPQDNSDVGTVWVFNRSSSATWTQAAKFSPSDHSSASQISTCSLSADGNTLIIGGYYDNSYDGANWVFTRSGTGTWLQQGSKIRGTGTVGIGTQQGYSVSISANGLTFVSGAPADGSSGAIWVYAWNGTSWGTGAKLLPTGYSASPSFGHAVAISGDGSTIAGGGYQDNSNVGAVWVYTGSGTSYTLQGSKLVPSDETGFQNVFGISVALSYDGNTLAVGNNGAVWIYKRVAGTWSEQTKIGTPPDAVSAQFGEDVSLNWAGTLLAVGGQSDSSNVGATWTYFYEPTVGWIEQAKSIGTGYSGSSYQGFSVDLDATGNTLAVGAYGDNSQVGAVWVFVTPEMSWAPTKSPSTSPTTSVPTKNPTKSPSKSPTRSPSRSPTRSPSKGPTTSTPTKSPTTSTPTKSPTTTAPTKSPTTSTPTRSPTRSPTKSPTTSTPTKSPTTSTPTKSPTVSLAYTLAPISSTGLSTYPSCSPTANAESVAISKDGLVMAVGSPCANSGVGAVTVFTFSGGVWTQSASITPTDNTGASGFGFSVAMDGSAGAYTIAIGGPFDNTNQGAIWVYNGAGSSWGESVKMTPAGGYYCNGCPGGTGYFPVGHTGSNPPQWGYSVAVRGYSNVVYWGAHGDNNGAGSFNSAVKTDVWYVTYPMTAPDTSSTSNQCGYSMSVASNGVFAVGCPGSSSGYGEVFLYGGPSGGLSAPASSYSTSANFGVAVALSYSGNYLVVGGTNALSEVGAVWGFTIAGSTVTSDVVISPTDYTSTAPGIGCSVAVDQYGTILAFGGQYQSCTGAGWSSYGSCNGAVWIYAKRDPAGSWVEQGGRHTDATHNNVNQGAHIGMDGSGNMVVATGLGSISAGVLTPLIWAWYDSAVTFGPTKSPSFSPSKNPTTTKPTTSPSKSPTVFVQWSQQAKLIGTSNSGQSYQGLTCISKDGNTLGVVGYGDNSFTGALWIWFRTGTSWAAQGTHLVPSDLTTGGGLGGCSLSADGNTLVIGAGGDTSSTGANWIYKRTGSTWAQQATKMVGSGATGTTSKQGTSVAISADGNKFVSGAQGDNGGIGAAWVWTWGGSSWSSVKITVSSNSGNSNAGHYVAMSPDGLTIALGGIADGTNSVGAVFMFTYSAGSWTQQQKVVPTGYTQVSGSVVYFGNGIALSYDGSTMVASGSNDNNGIGAVWIFTRSVNTWTQQGSKIVPSDLSGSPSVGDGVCINYAGTLFGVGGPGDSSSTGAVWSYIWSTSKSAWVEEAKLVGTSHTGNSGVGLTCALDATGNTMAAGGFIDNNYIGAAWVFVNNQMTFGPTNSPSVSPTKSPTFTVAYTQQGSKYTASPTVSSGQFGSCVALDEQADTMVVGSIGYSSARGAAYILTRSGTTWSQAGGVLSPADGVGNPQLGTHDTCAISGDGTTFAVGGPQYSGGYFVIYTKYPNGSYIEQALIQPNPANGNALGASGLSISRDGNYIAISSPGIGLVQIYTRSAGVWSLQQSITTSQVCASVSLSWDATILAFGCYQDTSSLGAVFVYTRSGTTWSTFGSKITPSTLGANCFNAACEFGYVVSLSGDGQTLVVSAVAEIIGGVSGVGAFYVLTKGVSAYTLQGSQIQPTLSGFTAAANCGYSLKMTYDGNVFVAGCNSANSNAGTVIAFERSGTTWIQITPGYTGSGATGSAQQGYGVALSSAGTYLAIGGSQDNTRLGAVWIYTSTRTATPTLSPTVTAG